VRAAEPGFEGGSAPRQTSALSSVAHPFRPPHAEECFCPEPARIPQTFAYDGDIRGKAMDGIQCAAQVAPQRSTQYSSLTRDLAPLELQAFSPGLTPLEWLHLGGIDYLGFAAAADEPFLQDAELLATFATVSGFFQRREEPGAHETWLRPLPRAYPYFVSSDMAYTRRYKGKTNEVFTQFLLNVAKFASDFRTVPWRQLRVFDPLCGGGTTLFLALALGADVAGVERDIKDAETTAAFVEQYATENKIPLKAHAERLRNAGKGRRWLFQLGKSETRKLILATGDTRESPHLAAALGRPHLVVADFPYGVQHLGPIEELATEALPVWASMLKPGGALAFSWDATRFGREKMAPLVKAAGLKVVERPPYDRMVHRVDRVIKRRDVMVALPPALPPEPVP